MHCCSTEALKGHWEKKVVKKCYFRSLEILFRSNELLFRSNEILFRSNERIFRGNEIGIIITFFFFLCPFRASVPEGLCGVSKFRLMWCLFIANKSSPQPTIDYAVLSWSYGSPKHV